MRYEMGITLNTGETMVREFVGDNETDARRFASHFAIQMGKNEDGTVGSTWAIKLVVLNISKVS